MARTGISRWSIVNNTYITPDGSYDILINGSNHYLNFGTLSGSSGYGFRDNAGTMEVKNSGGAWATIVGGVGAGATMATVSTGSTTTANSLYTMTSTVPVNFQRSGGSSLLYLDETNGRIGIGTTSPATLMELFKSTTPQLRINHTTASSYGEFQFSEGSTVQGGLYGIGSTFATTNRQNNVELYSVYGAVTLNTNNLERVRIQNDGNVGIGTTAPTALLEMSKAVSTDIGPVLRLTNAFGGQSSGGQIKFTAGSTQSSIYGTSTTGGEVNGSILTFRTSNTNNSTDVERVRIDHNGNVGIGTGTPGANLDISSGGTEQARFIGTGTGGASLRLNATGTSGENWRVLATASGNGEGAGKLLFQDGSSGNTFLSIVKSSGNVGIGTTAPTALLEMSKAVSTDIGPVLRLTNAFGGQSSGGQIKFTAGSTQSSIYGTSTTGGEVNGSILTFRTSNTNNSTDVERVRIDHNGNVGIGTTGPTAYLQIKAGTATANTAPLKFTSGTLNTTAEAGAVEFLTDAFYGTITTGAARKTFAFLESPSLVTPTANYFLRSVGNALTATGTTRTDALQLAKEINNITTAAAGTGVILPVGVVGMRITIFNAGANLIQVYASASETIDTVAGSTGVPLTNTKRCEYFFTTTNTWISAQLGVISA